MGCSADSVHSSPHGMGMCLGGTRAPHRRAGGGDPPFYQARPGACVSWPEKICLVLQEVFSPRKKLPRGVGFVCSCSAFSVHLRASKVEVHVSEISSCFSSQKRIRSRGKRGECRRQKWIRSRILLQFEKISVIVFIFLQKPVFCMEKKAFGCLGFLGGVKFLFCWFEQLGNHCSPFYSPFQKAQLASLLRTFSKPKK